MKPPQRRFIVEYKSGRRLPKTQIASIWGNVDLQALAREVEDQSSHLFGANRPVIQDDTAPEAASSKLVSALEPVVDEIAPEAPSVPVLDVPGSVASTSAALEEIAEPAPTAIELPSEAAVKLAKKTPRKRIVRTVMPVTNVADERQKPPASAEATPASVDELAALDAENKRLRQLLANLLRAQNAELERLLKRF
ncbi:hypothetical protein PWG15_34290 (plasmid) [Ensifer adhaerens]|uniref:hypothetical protein n=1 Tax=Ensifer adhaerens TaxID=106592 RepID=UPI0023A96487|nr:hypothetical protein [Ensifer adhaerens]WDZ81964.1 hypothetical protein PWG15_34290 [Ensifer adhaerens]